MNTETPKEAAERIAKKFHPRFVRMYSDSQELLVEVEAALKDRDERAARVAETHENTHGDMHFGLCGPAIAAAIRNRK